MLTRLGAALALTTAIVTEGFAQETPSPDRLVAYFLRRGAAGNWSPGHLFVGCPNLKPWQERGIEILMAADLSTERTRDVALALRGSLRCGDPRLEKWYFDRVDAAMRAGTDPTIALGLAYWEALNEGDSPAIRAYLRRIMLDPGQSGGWRSLGGSILFGKFEPAERLREYLALFETGQMPFEVQVGVTEAMLNYDADRLLREVGARVRARPVLAAQGAFTQIVETSNRFVTLAARRALADDLEIGLRQSRVSESQRERLERTVWFLRQPRR